MRKVSHSTLLAALIAVTTTCGRDAGAQEPPLPADYPRGNVSKGYRVDPAWPAVRSTYEWAAMAGIAVDDKGLVWTLNRGQVPVQVYSPEGKLVRQWGEGQFISAHQASIGPRGDVWITDSRKHVVYKFAPSGQWLEGVSKKPWWKICKS